MNCATARERLLEADLAELDGSRQGPLAEHLAACPACRALATRVLEGQRTLARSLAADVRSADPATLARAVGRRARPRRWPIAIPALAAAGIAAVLLRGGPSVPHTPGMPASPALPPLVQPAPGQDVAIYETDNPNIVIVWTF